MRVGHAPQGSDFAHSQNCSQSILPVLRYISWVAMKKEHRIQNRYQSVLTEERKHHVEFAEVH